MPRVRWWFWRRRRYEVSTEAREARQRAAEDLARVRRRAPRVDRVARGLAAAGTRNHWSERLDAAFRGVPDA